MKFKEYEMPNGSKAVFEYDEVGKITLECMDMLMGLINDRPQTDCNGCKFVGTYDTEFPCVNCSRKTKDYYTKDEPQERSE